METPYIIDTVRTPRARRKGRYSSVHPVDLLTIPLNEILSRNNISPENIDDVAIGCVTQTDEQGWCIGRAAVLAAGWPVSVPAFTVNRLCSSGLQACNLTAMGIKAGEYQLAVGGGVEHMTRVPMFSDCGGETSPLLKKHHPDLVHQGLAAEILAERFDITREEMDEYSYNSHMRAVKAQDEGRFNGSLVPVKYIDEEGNEQELTFDDNVRRDTSIEKLASLKPVFKDDGRITAGNASAIVDGAGVVLFANEEAIKRYNLRPRARVVSMASVGSDPLVMLTGPVPASRLALKRAGLSVNDIDVWEINEAFAPVPIYVMRELELDYEKVNINGGGISLGHPLGATGAMLLGTALDELERQNKKYALITLCIGLGMGVATVIERV